MAGVLNTARKGVRRFFRLRPKNKEIVVAINDYTPTVVNRKAKSSKGSRLTFNKGDRFVLKSSIATSWWYVKREGSSEKGYVPSNYLMKATDEAHVEWISFDMTKRAAEEELMRDKYGPGAFIIHEIAECCISHSLSLAVKVRSPPHSETFAIVHYVIERDGNAFLIGNSSVDTLQELVQRFAEHNRSDLLLTYSVKKREPLESRWEYEGKSITRAEDGDIGNGSFGIVFKGKLNGKDVAVKMPLKKDGAPPISAEKFTEEAEIARFCKHPFVLDTIGICRDPLYIITEYLANGCLKNFLKTHTLSIEICKVVARKIASAMEYLHSMKIVHRDLAARNILVGETIDIIKVADFGLARNLDESLYYSSEKEEFPIYWTAPEAIVVQKGIVTTQKGKIRSASDVWSYAVLLWELYTNGQMPYTGVGKDELHAKLTNVEKPLRLELPGRCPKKIYALMCDCWNLDWKKRPTFAMIRELLSREFLDGNDNTESTAYNPSPLSETLSAKSTNDRPTDFLLMNFEER